MSVECSLCELLRVDYAPLHTGSELTPERATLHEAGESAINGTSAHTDSPAAADGQADASHVDAPTWEAQTLCQDINQGKLAHQQRDQLEQKAV